MAKVGDLFIGRPKLRFNPLDFSSLSPEKFWSSYDELTDSIVCFFNGEPARATSLYIEDDDFYVMVDPQSRDIVGLHVELAEKKFIARYPLLEASWPHVKATLEVEEQDGSCSLLRLFSFGIVFLVKDQIIEEQIARESILTTDTEDH